MNNKMLRHVTALIGLAIAVLFSPGCATPKLQAGGAYSGKAELYRVDLAITSAYQVFDAFLAFEHANRASLGSDVQKSAAVIRESAPLWFSTAIALRDAYAAAPTDANKVLLDKSLAVLQAAVTEAAKYIATSSTK